MKIQYQIKNCTLPEVTYSNETFKVGDIVRDYSENYYKITKISKVLKDGVYLEFDENNYWATCPQVFGIRVYDKNFKKINGRKIKQLGLSYINSLSQVYTQTEGYAKRAERQHTGLLSKMKQIKTLMNENQIQGEQTTVQSIEGGQEQP